MIAKMKSNISVGETIGYNLKDESQLIDTHNLEGDNIQDYELQMLKTQELFEGRAKNLTAHIILSPSIEDGKKLKEEEWKSIASDYLKKANLEKYESIVFLHKDKEHTHLHIVANRIDEEGKIYRNGNEVRLSQQIGNEIAKERGLKQAREVMLQNQQLRKQGIEPKSVGSIQRIRDDLRETAKKTTEEHSAFDSDKYLQGLQMAGYKVSRYLDKENGQTKGYAIEKDGCFYPSYKIGKEYTLKTLEKEYGQEQCRINQANEKKKEQVYAPLAAGEETIQVKRYDYKNDKETIITVPKRIQEDFKKALDDLKYENPLQLKRALEEKGIGVRLDIEKGRYSLSKDEYTLNASEIGRGYTLGNLEKSKVHGQERQKAQELMQEGGAIQRMKKSLQQRMESIEKEEPVQEISKGRQEKEEAIKKDQSRGQQQQL